LLAVGLSALLVTAGCSGTIGGLGADGDGSGPQLDSVPASAEYVAYVDAAGMASDESLRSIANAALDARSEYDDGAPENVDAMFEQAESESGLDPTKVGDVTAFGTTPENPIEGEGTAAVVLSTSYSVDELVAAVEEQGGELTEGTYGDTTLYVSGSGEDSESVLGVLGDGTFAVGDRSAVEDVVDVRAGDADSLNGDLKTTFESTDDGYVRFAMATPTDGGASEEIASEAPVDASALENVEYVSGSFATGDGNLTTTVNLVAGSESDAEQTYDLVDGALSLYSSMGEENGEAQNVLDAVSVEQDGETVTVTHTDTVENVEGHVEALYGMGSMGGYASGSNSTSASMTTVAAGE
jgi:hypothetical protein